MAGGNGGAQHSSKCRGSALAFMPGLDWPSLDWPGLD